MIERERKERTKRGREIGKERERRDSRVCVCEFVYVREID
jgi:hypothetical protein